ncbi:MAG: hypothetical protein E6K81_04955 [Candidatus Eisenbacteria bacterium]|uniref:Uncharacterized protein n=1 Tax=Eiseniibacteriota bacterium TaxID=2212470 RepID=A0A538UBW4_UNCEI|nr:MAG: hypothetical protein E6K81_04955 [Candidatus Eisenbacteria bacterium]
MIRPGPYDAGVERPAFGRSRAVEFDAEAEHQRNERGAENEAIPARLSGHGSRITRRVQTANLGVGHPARA